MNQSALDLNSQRILVTGGAGFLGKQVVEQLCQAGASADKITVVRSRLVTDEDFRLSLGNATKKQIEEIHAGSNWQHRLEYDRATTLPRITLTLVPQDQTFMGKPDVFLQKVFPFENLDVDQMILDHVRLMPLGTRLSFWFKLIKMGNFGRMGLINLFLPDWLYRRLERPMKE